MKWEIQSIDYDDMLIFCNNGFKNNPALLARYRAMYSYIMVDEFQDTNELQYIILSKIYKANKSIKLMFVGDVNQAIYSSLGASCIIKMWMLKIENTSEYNKTTDWQVSKNLIIQRGIYNEV